MDDDGSNEQAVKDEIQNAILNNELNLACLQDIPPPARDFISKCLIKDPAQRITAVNAIKHPFIRGIGSTSTR